MEDPETFVVVLSSADSAEELTYEPVTGTILEATTVIEIPSGETVVANEDGMVVARNDGDVLFQAERKDVARLRFVSDDQDSTLEVRDLGKYRGLRTLVQFDGNGGTDILRIPDSNTSFDLDGPLHELTGVEQIDVSTVADIAVTAEGVRRNSTDDQLMLMLGQDTRVSLDSVWEHASPRLSGSEAIYRITQDQALVELATENAWHNPVLAHDVNRDGKLSELDALVVINALSRSGDRDLESVDSLTEFPGSSLDVSDDGQLGSIDAIRVINELNRQSVTSAEPSSGSVYTIGNSLTWDTVPSLLDEGPTWHTFCSRNLVFIKENPDGHCVDTSTPWPQALDENQFDWVVVQPFDGTTLDQDATIISEWMASQPDANFVLHTGWARHGVFSEVLSEGNPDNEMRSNQAYIQDLIDEVHERNPGRTLTSTWAFEYLEDILSDIEAGVGPFGELSHLYRDHIHLTRDAGRYLMHNVLRQTVGQPTSAAGFDIDPVVRAYLDDML